MVVLELCNIIPFLKECPVKEYNKHMVYVEKMK